MVANPIHGTHGHEALRGERKYLYQAISPFAKLVKTGERVTMAMMTQMKSHRKPNIPADRLSSGEKAAAFARSRIKIRANVASVHVMPSITGPWAP